VKEKIHSNLNNLFNMKNREEYRYEKTDSYDMQIRLMECVCRLGGGVGDNYIGMDNCEKSANPFGKNLRRSTSRV
jgi:hypothetical protein